MSGLTKDEMATNFETMRHIERVRNLLNLMICDLLRRGENHDQSKLEPPEVADFTRMTPILASLTYGSPEYAAARKELDKTLQHHYANNSHHPEHYKEGVNDMTLMDIVEMFCDWKAASERHHDGNILKSIEINAERFGISLQLRRIMENTAKKYFN